jgi:hypothetical protein
MVEIEIAVDGRIGAAGGPLAQFVSMRSRDEPQDVVDFIEKGPRGPGPRNSSDGNVQLSFPEGYEDMSEQDGYQVTGGRDSDRPTWQESEAKVGEEVDWADFDDQRSFKNGEDVSRGTRGSTRPDLYSRMYKLSVDVKNYEIETREGQRRLVDNVIDQVNERAPHLPEGSRQSVVIDARGQDVARATLEAIRGRIVRNAGGLVTPDDVVFLTE